MDEGWHVAGMILTVQIAEKMRLELGNGQCPAPLDRCAILRSNVGTNGNGHSIWPGPVWGIRS
jgi:hypothetical protein